MLKKTPLRFHPYLKSVIWGGDKICRYKEIPQTEKNIGESWEISAVPGHESVVAEDEYKGWKITELIERFGPDLLGRKVWDKYDGKFPLLIKIIDANDNLSVQVHPDDALAMSRHGSLGKTEMWYIIESENGARIFSGLNKEITPEEYLERVANDTFAELMADHDSFAGDVFFLPAGRVHAIGGGNLLAEIQESSDITYRIYDYNRVDSNGRPRELHTSQAKDAIDFKFYSDYKSALPSDEDKIAEIAACEHFKVNRVLLDKTVEFEFNTDSFTVVICIDGEAVISSSDGNINIKKGQTVLCPAIMDKFSLSGKATLLTARVF